MPSVKISGTSSSPGNGVPGSSQIVEDFKKSTYTYIASTNEDFDAICDNIEQALRFLQTRATPALVRAYSCRRAGASSTLYVTMQPTDDVSRIYNLQFQPIMHASPPHTHASNTTKPTQSGPTTKSVDVVEEDPYDSYERAMRGIG